MWRLITLTILTLMVIVGLVFYMRSATTVVTPKLRQQIDQLANQLPQEKLAREAVSWSGDLTGWLVKRMHLSPQEEVEISERVHQGLITTNQIIQPARELDQITQRLVEHIPQQLMPPGKGFEVTVFQDEKRSVFASGSGHLYVTTGALQNYGIHEAATAFLLAHEMGHACRKHAHEGYRYLLLENNRDLGLLGKLGGERYREIFQTVIRKTDDAIQFAYSDRQDLQADLFALHLCRNAGFKAEECLDSLRLQIIDALPEWRQDAQDGSLDVHQLPAQIELATTQLLKRLQNLRHELDGVFPANSEYGLMKYDADSENFTPTDKAVNVNRAVIFIHGMEAKLDHFDTLLRATSGMPDAPLVLGFQFPNDGSLCRAATRLKADINRTIPEATPIHFVCHSAGGLVCRHYKEVLDGRANSIIFLGTPHYGSDLAKLRAILELKQILTSFTPDIPETLERAILDGDGQITFDLQPNSLFLTGLNQQSLPRDGYVIVRGRAMVESQAQLLERGFSGALRLAKVGLLPLRFSDTGKRLIGTLEDLSIPEEITEGDLAVTLESAALDGVTPIETVPLDHLKLIRDQAVAEQVVQWLEN